MDRLLTDEIERRRENIGRGREYRDNDVSDKHGTLLLFRDADDFLDVFMLLDCVLAMGIERPYVRPRIMRYPVEETAAFASSIYDEYHIISTMVIIFDGKL